MYDPYAEFTKTVLPNGLEVHSVFWNRPWVGVGIVIHAGGREDPIEKPGLAHFIEHLVSENIPENEFDSVKEFFEVCGGETGFGSTQYLSTDYGFCVPADPVLFEKSLNIFGSMLLQAKLVKGIERERKVIYREFNEKYPFLEKLGWDMASRKALFKGHRLETWNRPLGRPEGFLHMVREDFQSFYDRYYVPANMCLVVVGGMPAEESIKQISDSPFGTEKPGCRNLIPHLFEPSLPSDFSKTVKLSDHSSLKVDLVQYTATWAFPASFPTQTRRLLRILLGKILNDEIRQKLGSSYGVDVQDTPLQDIVELEVECKVGPESASSINEIVMNCISDIPSRIDFFERKKKMCMQKCFMTDLSGYVLADNAGEELAEYHRIIPMQEVYDDLQKLTFENVVEAATYLTPNRQFTTVVRP